MKTDQDALTCRPQFHRVSLGLEIVHRLTLRKARDLAGPVVLTCRPQLLRGRLAQGIVHLVMLLKERVLTSQWHPDFQSVRSAQETDHRLILQKAKALTSRAALTCRHQPQRNRCAQETVLLMMPLKL